MNNTEVTFSRYLPVNPEALRWEIHCNDAGYSQVPPGASYPLDPDAHPKGYADTVVTGRLLPEFQVVYIVAGRGHFQAERMGSCSVSAGDIMILFPGVRHAYRPSRETGWHEYWVGFSGEHAYRLWHNGLFCPEQAVHHIGLNQEVLADYEQIVRLCRQQTPGFQVRMGALVLQLLAHIHSIETTSRTAVGDSELVQRTRTVMQQCLDTGIEVEAIAEQVGVGYSRLLEVFRHYTGLTPYQYFLQLRIHRAKELLQNPRLSIKEVAARMNFENQYYFSRLFKNKAGVSPSQWKSGLTAGKQPPNGQPRIQERRR
ncbi:MAG: AraC family transcriptional regulator [Spirochaetaceae bacterium]|nr:MAG: AraC family transcriptional regulator [Spirochaetaceae bacterium]